ncbi:FHA domain-containing protein [Kangiella spongicola]|uniref:Phosphopeptide-binding protein n=1 Tax=Kangiella spongicola TaxID=796379 RepID=A0A318D6C6_9GAMM|nr:FHA domain-containing protein [Kangiella spongicola]MBV36487.1 phosphopeptide-binding protein [Rickettsiales bacterium]PXF62744.1 phosphopeptide-binding protein [Kangiella spongicola]
MPARITACYPDKPAKESLLFEDSQYQVGRDLDCEVRLNHPSVSRKHARVITKGEQWYLKDAESSNGIKVNGRSVSDHLLSANDVISLGDIECLFELKTKQQLDAIDAHNEWRIQQSRKDYNELARKSLLEALDEQLYSLLNLTGTQRGLVMLGNSPDTLTVCASKGMTRKEFHEKSFEGSVGAMQRAISNRSPVLAMDVKLDNNLAARESIQRKQIAALACIPLLSNNNLVGIVYTDSKEANKILTELDLEILNLISEQIKINSEAIVLQNEISAILNNIPEQIFAEQQLIKEQILAVH